MKPLLARLLERTEKQDRGFGSPCWIWQGSTQNGYGVTGFAGVPSGRVHRSVFLLSERPIPEGLCLDHLCRVRACCNPDHLEAVTLRENALRGLSFERLTHCSRGHAVRESAYRVPKTGMHYCRACKNLRRRQKDAQARTLRPSTRRQDSLALLADINAFCRAHDLSEATFGSLALNDWRFVRDLRGEKRPVPRSVLPGTEAKVRQFMAGYAPERIAA